VVVGISAYFKTIFLVRMFEGNDRFKALQIKNLNKNNTEFIDYFDRVSDDEYLTKTTCYVVVSVLFLV